jgi:hypothetical protein
LLAPSVAPEPEIKSTHARPLSKKFNHNKNSKKKEEEEEEEEKGSQ